MASAVFGFLELFPGLQHCLAGAFESIKGSMNWTIFWLLKHIQGEFFTNTVEKVWEKNEVR